jgi:hypothetical protein
MGRKLLIIAFICVLPALGFSQTKAQVSIPAEKVKNETSGTKDQFPPQSVDTDDYTVSHPSFLKKGDNMGKGEVLEVGFDITNNTDNPHSLYLFVIATYEDTKWQYNSFANRKVIPQKVAIEYFSPSPDDVKNFEYDINGVKELKKYPKDYKLGVDPQTGKIFTLKDKLIVRTQHLNLYRKNFKFYNNVTIIVFDDEGKTKFRQTFALKGKRR